MAGHGSAESVRVVRHAASRERVRVALVLAGLRRPRRSPAADKPFGRIDVGHVLPHHRRKHFGDELPVAFPIIRGELRDARQALEVREGDADGHAHVLLQGAAEVVAQARGAVPGVTGHIGRAVIDRLSGFGCHILAYDVYPNADLMPFATYVDLDTLLAQSDILTLHMPATDATHHIINLQSLARTQKDVCMLRLYMHAENTRARQSYERLGMTRTKYEVFELDVRKEGERP